ncbi:hypothetical protein ACHAXR_013152 [Thalassiosira sp. AJA248-18]
MVKQLLTGVLIVLGILLLTIEHGDGAAFGLSSSTNKKTSQRSSSPALLPLPVATIDAAELFDGSFFGGSSIVDDDAVENNSNCEEGKAIPNNVGGDGVVGFTSYASSSSSVNVAMERISSSSSNNNLVWGAIGAILSLSAVINSRGGAIIGISSSLRLLSSISSWYMMRLEVAPLLTKCITGGIVALIGDYGAQWFEYKMRSKAAASSAISLRAGGGTNTHRISRPFSIRGTYDIRRGIARFLECLLISSPLMHYGYDLFESIMPVVGGAGIYQSFAALTHVLADCVFLDGIFVGTGILATGLLEGNSLRKKVLPNLRNVYLPTLKASIMTSGALVPLQFLSFRFLPVQLRVLSVNAVDLIWTGVVSFVSHGGDMEKVRVSF